MTGLLERIGFVIHWMGLACIFACLWIPFIWLAGNIDTVPPEAVAGAAIWWPIRWLLTGRTSLKPINPKEISID